MISLSNSNQLFFFTFVSFFFLSMYDDLHIYFRWHVLDLALTDFIGRFFCFFFLKDSDILFILALLVPSFAMH